MAWSVFRQVANRFTAGLATAEESVTVVDYAKLHTEVASFPIMLRDNCLVLHGPIEQTFRSLATFTQTYKYNLILHVPNSDKMFSLSRSDDNQEVEDMFILYRETFPTLVNIDPLICDRDKIERICQKLLENRGWTAIHMTAYLDYYKFFRHESFRGQLENQEGTSLHTPLQIAILAKNLASVKELLDLKVNIEHVDLNGNTILHFAAKSSTQILQTILEKRPDECNKLIDYINNEGKAPLHIACKNNDVTILKMLLNAGANVNIASRNHGYPIHMAVQAKSICSIQELIKKYPHQLQLKDLEEGGTALHWSDTPDILAMLLSLGCDPNIENFKGNVPLHNTARRGDLKGTLILLAHHVYPDVKGENGDTPLHVAARLCSKHIMQALIVFGADIDVLNEQNDSPRHLVATSLRSDKDEILHILTAVGAMRCPESNADRCTNGCKFSGSFDGIPPENYNIEVHNLMHESLHAFGVQKEMQNKVHKRDSARSSRETTPGGCERMEVDNCPIGGRLLSLDGGGIRGLVHLQTLAALEKVCEVPIVELFDWIAGTSTGGLIALGLATKKSVKEVQGLYFRLKDQVFVGDRPYSSEKMEDFLKAEFGADLKMNSIRRPRVMVTSVVVDRKPIEFHFFRNYTSPTAMLQERPCEDCEEFVWAAAKATGSAPTYFKLDGKFVDGGLMANNPTLDAMTELQHFNATMKALGVRGTFSGPTVVVSLGCGVTPQEEALASNLNAQWPRGIFDVMSQVPKLASLINLLIDQATQAEGQVVERARSWCSSIGIPFYRFSPLKSKHVELDERNDEVLVNLMWETKAYMYRNTDLLNEVREALFLNSPHGMPNVTHNY